ncbi:MAG: prolyl oligopeptidase family serine peptidase, partial [Planctomycetota bacterium]|nr:prolyl oligopeptidase family serine peptidase [Planctomycetota bacterium]
IEKTLYFSVPGFPVTSLLYLPKKRRGRCAAVLFVCGHAMEAKAYPVYQAVCADLAANGLVVLAVDPPGQGERMQYADPETGRQWVTWGTTEHSYAGMQYYAAGMSIARQFVWDAIRGLDYLCSRPEVDPSRIGLTGNSGGGTQSCFLMMCEDRFAAAAPGTFVMDYESYLKTGQGQDGEQNLARSFAEGPDHDDYITAMAPKPVLILCAAYDFFPIEGTMRTLGWARRAYALYGKPENVDAAVGEHPHEYSAVLRQAAVNFFRVHLQGRDASFRTGTPSTLPPAELNVTPEGQVRMAMPEAPTVHSLLLREMAARGPSAAARLPKAMGPEERRRRLRDIVRETLAIPEKREEKIYPRVITDTFVDGYGTQKVFFFSEPDIAVTGVFVRPRAGAARTTEMILFPRGTDEIPERRGDIERILESGRNIFVFDVRGVGAVASRPITREAAKFGEATEWVLGCNAMKLGASTLGMRVFDVLRGYDYLASRPDAGRITVRGVGDGAVWAYLAAALEDGFAGVVLEDFAPSWKLLVSEPLYLRRLLSFRSAAFGVLRAFDLPDLAACIAPRPLAARRPLDAKGGVMNERMFHAVFTKIAVSRGGVGKSWKPEVALD